MSHDFDEKHQGKNCDKKGIMSYGDAPTAWSSCSISDFTDYYLAAKWGEHCMKGNYKNEFLEIDIKCSFHLDK